MSRVESQGGPPRRHALPYLLAGAVVTALIALLSFHRVAGTDIWYHMAAGRWMLDHHAIPRHNLFMYTYPHTPWVAHAYLAQVAFFLIYHLGGIPAIQVFVAAAYTAWFGILLWLWWRMGVSLRLAAIPFLLAILLPVGRYTPRPELFTAIFLATTVTVTLTWREFGTRWIWALPALVALWVNVHGGVTYGVIFLVLFAAGEAAQAALARVVPALARSALPPRPCLILGVVAVASTLALLVNPCGAGWFRTIQPSYLRFMASLINEWRPLLEPGLDTKVPLPVVFVFLAVAWASFAVRRGLHLGSLAVAAAFTAAPFTSLRHLPMCGLVLLGLMAFNLRHAAWPAPLRRVAPAASRSLAVAGLLFGLAVLLFALNAPYFGWLGVQQRLGFGVDTDVHPVAADRYIEQNRIRGPMFHEWWYSGFVVWRHYPERSSFMDWIEAYGPEIVSEYKEIAQAGPRATALMDRWKINYFFLQSPDPASRPPSGRDIYTLLSESPDWGLVYWDGIAVIYLRRDAENAPLLRRFEYHYLNPVDPLSPANLRHPQEVARELERAIATNPVSSLLRAQAGRIYLQLGMPDRAVKEFREAIRLDPDSSAAYTGLGLVSLRGGDLPDARDLFATAARLAPEDPWPHRGLAQVAQAGNDWREAAREWARVVRLSPATVRDRVALALAEEAAGDPRAAAQAWREVLALNPDPDTARLAREHLAALSGASP